MYVVYIDEVKIANIFKTQGNHLKILKVNRTTNKNWTIQQTSYVHS